MSRISPIKFFYWSWKISEMDWRNRNWTKNNLKQNGMPAIGKGEGKRARSQRSPYLK
jgi:hypothetical protein